MTNLSQSDHVSGLEQNDEIDVVDTSQIIEQGLIQELTQNQYKVACQSNSTFSDDKINKSCIQNIENLIPGSAKSLLYLFDKAIKKGQEKFCVGIIILLNSKTKLKVL